MDLELRGMTALLTGASSGIGAATALLLAEEGCDVVVGYHRNEAGAGRTAGEIRSLGRSSWLCRMDVTDPEEVEVAVTSLSDAARSIDILVLCAGEAASTPFEQLTAEQWRRIIDVNLNGAFHVLHSVRPLLTEAASVVTVASVSAHTGVPLQAHYAAAKAGLVGLTKSAARALAPIRVNCVAPGITLTEMGAQTTAALPAGYAREKLLLQRFAEPLEIAKCIVFLASPASSFITGATLDVNGGRDLR